MVSKAAFASAGEVRSFELFSGKADRALRVGIYRPVAGGSCKFQLMQQQEWMSFSPGYHKVCYHHLGHNFSLWFNNNCLQV